MAGSLQPAQAEAIPATLPALSRAFKCEIVDRLTRIAAGDSSTSKDRFIVVSPTARPDAYVQCIFIDADRAMHCEAASGAFGQRDAGDANGPARLGYGAGPPDKNFAQRVLLGTDGDLGRVADLILRTLHDGFGVTLPVSLTIHAPHGRRPRGIPPLCEARAVS